MHPRILRDYCEHGLVQVESGQYELACPPEIERPAVHWPDCSHFIPMQKPDEVVAIIKEELALWQTDQTR